MGWPKNAETINANTPRVTHDYIWTTAFPTPEVRPAIHEGVLDDVDHILEKTKQKNKVAPPEQFDLRHPEYGWHIMTKAKTNDSISPFNPETKEKFLK